ncbi:hypothetical protein NDU88_001043, partial [Pleurodeles waltl]
SGKILCPCCKIAKKETHCLKLKLYIPTAGRGCSTKEEEKKHGNLSASSSQNCHDYQKQ